MAWWLAEVVTDEPSPTLAALTALVVVQVSVRGSLLTALQRSAAVVLGVLLALAIGDALDLNAVTVAVLVAVSLGIAELGLRLPRAAARQVPVSVLVVLAAVSLGPASSSWHRASDTVLGAVVGVGISFALPASSVGRIAAVKANGLVLVRFISQSSPARWFNPSNVELI